MPIRTINPTKQAILATLPPPSTRTYKTISHGQIIDALYENLDKNSFRVKSEEYSATINNQIVIGHLKLDLSLDKELGFEIAFVNSYNKAKRAIVVAGSHVYICGNGHVLGDASLGSFKRKHTGDANIKIDTFIPEMIKNAQENFLHLIKQKDRMKEIELDRRVRNELIGQLYLDEAIIKDTQMSIIKKEFEKSSFDYGVGKDNLWHVYNNITVGLKNSHPTQWLTSHQQLNKIVNEKFLTV